MSISQLRKNLRELADPAIAHHSQRFFKTGPGEYGEGDKFLGIRVPILREQARKFKQISLQETRQLLKSTYHEERLCALFLLVEKYSRGSTTERENIYRLYLAHTRYINNWDLVDSSAPKIIGAHLEDKDRQPLYQLATSSNLWERRIAIMSTLHFIRQRQFDETLAISELLINDEEDLIHKAVGWMLREVGNRDGKVERVFLKAHYLTMPRTMLRYAIEKFPQLERKKYLKSEI
ncbi:MAG: DNA alkylation repair protein [Candidatus Thiodiazotropha sp. (ex Semelilucina semeliformis)]|nr:DNA alkylation repair protein [Candidatus Thiodiazotropha sp. (ex Semelilucina semeliformis)]